jgi:hypothetical protein
MNRMFLRAAVVALAVLAAGPTAARIGSCGGCGTVIDVDAIFYPRDKAREDADAGTIVGGTPGTRARKPAAPSAATGGLVGRLARDGERGDDARGLRLELKLDGGGRRTLEIGEGVRVYKGDRVRVSGDRIEMLD